MRRRVCSLLLCLMAITAAAADIYINRGRGFPWGGGAGRQPVAANCGADTLTWTIPCDAGDDGFRLRLTAENRHAQAGRSYPYIGPSGKRHKAKTPGWRVSLADSTGRAMAVIFDTDGSLLADDSPRDRILVTLARPDGTECHAFVPGAGKRHLFEITRSESKITVTADGEIILTADAAAGGGPLNIASLSVSVAPGGEVDIPALSLTHAPPVPEMMKRQRRTLLEIDREISTSADTRAGYWGVAARSLEENMLRLGGEYVLALIPDSRGGYDIYYISGAKTSAQLWSPGYVKGHLTPDNTGGWDVMWRDSNGAAVQRQIKGVADDNDNITLHFPYHNGSTLSLRRIRDFSPATAIIDDTDL